MSQDKGRGILFVLSAPSGTGKTSIAEHIVANTPCITRSVSHTTRPIRKDETHGKDYIFVDEAKFKEMIDKNEFIEYANVHEKYYGTATESVAIALEVKSDKTDHILVIDIQGAANIREKGLDAVYIFLLPPSMEELKRRMSMRGTEEGKEIEKRLVTAKKEIAACASYDYIVVNDDLDTAAKEVANIIKAERSKRGRQEFRFPDYELPELS